MLTYLQSQQASGFLLKLMPVGWGLEVSEHDSPLAAVRQSDATKRFSGLASIAVLAIGKVPATLFERVAGLFQPF